MILTSINRITLFDSFIYCFPFHHTTLCVDQSIRNVSDAESCMSAVKDLQVDLNESLLQANRESGCNAQPDKVPATTEIQTGASSQSA